MTGVKGVLNMSNKRCIVDRFEGDWAVIEYGDITFDIPKSLLVGEVRVGDVIDIQITPNAVETEQRKKAIDELRKRLSKK